MTKMTAEQARNLAFAKRVALWEKYAVDRLVTLAIEDGKHEAEVYVENEPHAFALVQDGLEAGYVVTKCWSDAKHRHYVKFEWPEVTPQEAAPCEQCGTGKWGTESPIKGVHMNGECIERCDCCKWYVDDHSAAMAMSDECRRRGLPDRVRYSIDGQYGEAVG